MRYKILGKQLSKIFILEAGCMLPPLAVSFFCGEHAAFGAFAVSFFAAAFLGSALFLLCRRADKPRLRESRAIIAVCWISAAIFGAFPFFLSGEIPVLLDAVFESISGFTTTAATVLSDAKIVAMPKSLLLWRSLSAWLGGIGFFSLLFVFAGGNTLLFQAENPDPFEDNATPRFRQNARLFFFIYLSFTLAEFILLLIAGIPVFDSLNIALCTMGTGGFSVQAGSLSAYGSLAEGITAVFMLLSGISLNVYAAMIIAPGIKHLLDDELKTYITMFLAGTLLITVSLWQNNTYPSLFTSLKESAFHTASFLSTTGFSGTQLHTWPAGAKIVIFLLIIAGASAGSAGGGIKSSRGLLLLRESKASLRRLARPNHVEIVTFNKQHVSRSTIHFVNTYLILYIILFGISFLLISLDNLDFFGAASVVIACMSNTGPAFALAGTVSYSELSALTKIILSVNMLMGRLEIYPMLLLFSAKVWRNI